MTPSVTVAVDAGGADLGPSEVMAGAAIAAAQGVNVKLFGDVSQITETADGVEVIDAPLSIAKDPDPARAVRRHPESSIVQAVRAVAAGEADAFVSGGSTGAALAAGLFDIKRDRGIHRPALAIPIPVPGAPVTLLDVGANVEVRAEHLVQFAFMGAAFAQAVLGIERPRVALLSNGEEATKGTSTLVEAHTLLAEKSAGSPVMTFLGNVEGTDVVTGAADVIVTDGFTGNVALKLIEGVSQMMISAIRDVATSTPRAKAGGLLLRPALRGFRDEIDPEGPGGAYLLGLRKLGVVPHGRFTRFGFSQAILLAARGSGADVVGRTNGALQAAGALKTRNVQAPGGDDSAPSDPSSTVSAP